MSSSVGCAITSKAGGFTLIEVLVVVVILSILAAITVPMLANASDEAKNSVLRSDLSMVRGQILLYMLQHNGMPPGYIYGENGQLSNWNGSRFVLQLVGTTDEDGNLGEGPRGPYMQRFPTNDFATQANKAALVKNGAPNGNDEGWAFDPNTNEFWANDDSAEHQSW